MRRGSGFLMIFLFLVSLSGCTTSALMKTCTQWEYQGSHDIDVGNYVGAVTDGCQAKCGCSNDGRSIACESGSKHGCYVSCARDWDLACSRWAEFPARVNFITGDVLAVRRSAPAPFTFSPRVGVAPGELTTSDALTVSGIDSPAPISISDGEYSINGDAYTSEPGMVNSGDTVTVRQTAADSYSTTTEAVLTIGGVSGTFSVTTAPAPTSVPQE